VFDVLQGISSFVIGGIVGGTSEIGLFLSYVVAAVVTCALAASWFGSRDQPLVPFFRTTARGRALLLGGALGVACGIVGLGWQQLRMKMGWVADESSRSLRSDAALAWFAAVAVFAAPPCEEFIFRGLVFAGMRRSFGVARAAVASALLFAILHPMPGFPPIFLLGLATAWAASRTDSLLASITAHLVYNLLVVGGAYFLMR
jgi:membrane protease YdiL (CAAX protease family)